MRADITFAPAVAIAVLSLACTVDTPDDNNPFATGTPTMTSAPPATTTGGDSSSGGGEGSGGVSSSSSGGEESSDGVDSTGALTTGPMMTTGVSMGSSSDGGNNGMQPAMGMYSFCSIPEDCGFAPALCITIQDDMGVAQGGFCSATPCGNPALDCDPSPGGTATPMCIGITVNMVPDTACYLDCTGGGTCPSPMVCTAIEGGFDLCV